MREPRLEGEASLITTASRCFGAAIAEELATAEAHIIVNCSGANKAAELLLELRFVTAANWRPPSFASREG